ncbi:hypothetical protein JOL79_11615 [Microbispora sp. RL4-1S]|uniref:Uncharacterized protein n=1 Tax=Microbispora oryzae TaxID=2806554 RepID=A0A940WI94_9ACTN|nr:hypothetical protein [Microbispora oryzae]MBP2704462.1 hypothetical protein [Microbispora oryzae]
MTELGEAQAGRDPDSYAELAGRAAAGVPQYVSALCLGALAGVIVLAAVLTGSVAVIVTSCVIAGAMWGWGSVYGIKSAQEQATGRVRAAEQRAADWQNAAARTEAELARVAGDIEGLAADWERLHPAVPGACVRQLRELLDTRMGDVR